MEISTQDPENTASQPRAPPDQLGSLHKRRVEASPEKFNTGQFEPLKPQVLVTNKRIRTEDGTPRAAPSTALVPGRTQLTAFLSNFNLTPTTNVNRPAYPHNSGTPGIIEDTASFPTLGKSQLTAGLANFGFATPTAYAVPLSAITPTPKTKAKRPFNLIDAFCANNELLLLLTSYLNIPSLISLYAISKTHHHQFNCHYTAHILAIMRTWAPHSEVIFPWRSYKRLSTKDPNMRQMSRMKGKEAEATDKHEDLRDVPTIRWLQMVVYRHGVCTDMLVRLASYGHRCPAGTLDALKRLWFLLDLPTNNQRNAIIHSKAYISDTAIMFLTHFFLKLDMHFTEPMGRMNPNNHPDTHRFPPRHARKGFVGTQLRQTLLGERSLTPLWRVLRGWTPDPREPAVHMDRLDIVKLWVRHYYKPNPDTDPKIKALRVMGIPWHELGTAQMERLDRPQETVEEQVLEEMISLEDDEGVGEILKRSVNPFRTVVPLVRRVTRKLVRVDQLVMRESVRREMNLWEHWVRMMVWGWCDPVGRTYPIWTDEELYGMRKGIAPKSRGVPPAQAEKKKDEQQDAKDAKKDESEKK